MPLLVGFCVSSGVGSGVASGEGAAVGAGVSSGVGAGVNSGEGSTLSMGTYTGTSDGSAGTMYSPGVPEGAIIVSPGVGLGSVRAGVVSGFAVLLCGVQAHKTRHSTQIVNRSVFFIITPY